MQTQLVEQGARPVVALGFGDVTDFHAKLDVGERGSPRQQQVLLKHIANIGRPESARANRLPVPANLARIRRNETADQVQERGLSASRRSDNADDLALAEHEAQIADHPRYFVGGEKAFGDVLDRKGGNSLRLRTGGRHRVCGPRGRRLHQPAILTALSAKELSITWSNEIVPLMLPRYFCMSMSAFQASGWVTTV